MSVDWEQFRILARSAKGLRVAVCGASVSLVVLVMAAGFLFYNAGNRFLQFKISACVMGVAASVLGISFLWILVHIWHTSAASHNLHPVLSVTESNVAAVLENQPPPSVFDRVTKWVRSVSEVTEPMEPESPSPGPSGSQEANPRVLSGAGESSRAADEVGSRRSAVSPSGSYGVDNPVFVYTEDAFTLTDETLGKKAVVLHGEKVRYHVEISSNSAIGLSDSASVVCHVSEDAKSSAVNDLNSSLENIEGLMVKEKCRNSQTLPETSPVAGSRFAEDSSTSSSSTLSERASKCKKKDE